MVILSTKHSQIFWKKSHTIKSLPEPTIGTEYFWTGVGVLYLANLMFSIKWESIGESNSVIGSGTFKPLASTGMSAYFSKLMPVVCFKGSPGSPNKSNS